MLVDEDVGKGRVRGYCRLPSHYCEILFFFFVMKLTRIEVMTFKLNLFLHHNSSLPPLLSSPLLSSPPPLLHNGNIHSRRQVRSLDETKTGSLLHLEPNELAPWS